MRKYIFLLVFGFFFAYCFSSSPSRAIACTYPPEHYKLTKESPCLGTWTQEANNIQIESVVACYDSNGNRISVARTSKTYLDTFDGHNILRKSGCHKYFGKKSEFFSAEQGVAETGSELFVNFGDIYSKP